ncbi:MAG: hypothetical protein IJV77_02970 [Clostridia bacterium]|nr:hypothetical protein [Clostridia bacterium]
MSKHEKEIKKIDRLALGDVYPLTLFYKMHCHHCGELLTKRQVYHHGWIDTVARDLWIEEHEKKFIRFGDIGWGERHSNYMTDWRFYYHCPKCDSKISYLSQKKIRKLQKVHKTLTLDESLTKDIPMAQKRDYTDLELFWTLVECSDRQCFILKNKK